MGESSRIAWTDHTFNPWWGCERVSPGCQNCYAEAFAKRTGHDVWGRSADRRFLSDAAWSQPVKWNRKAEAEGVRRRVFCASMADVFEDRADLDGKRLRLWGLIEQTPALDWLLLTKRPQNILGMVPGSWMKVSCGHCTAQAGRPEWARRPCINHRALLQWPRNVWVGTTVEDQQRADERIPLLLDVPAPVRFLSCEPLIGRVDMYVWLPHSTDSEILGPLGGSGSGVRANSVDWVIVGGESGSGHRTMDLGHARSLVGQCEAAGVPVFFKQVSGPRPGAVGPDDLERFKQFPKEKA